MSEYPTVYLMTSTVGPYEFYFEETKERLEERGLKAKNVIPNSPYLEEFEKQIISQLDDEINDVALAAWSFAGNVAGEVGRKRPEKVEKVIFIDSVLEWRYQPRSDRILMKFLLSLPENLRNRVFGNKLLLKSMLNKMIKRDIDEEIRSRIFCSSYVLGGKWLAEAIESGMEYTDIDSKKLIEDLQDNDIEVYMIYSSDDTKNYLEKSGVKEILPESNFYEIDSGHLPMFEAPEKFHKVIHKVITL